MKSLPHLLFLPFAALALLAGCQQHDDTAPPSTLNGTSTAASPAAPPPAEAPKSDAKGAEAQAKLKATRNSSAEGEIEFEAAAGGVRLKGEIEGLTSGSVNAIHVHEKGDCSAPDASSAGGHLNPDNQPHGEMTAAQHHAGDIPNVTADGSGKARIDLVVPGLEIGTGSPRDVIGKSLVLHAKADDYHSQPAGNAGDRIACGVIEKD